MMKPVTRSILRILLIAGLLAAPSIAQPISAAVHAEATSASPLSPIAAGANVVWTGAAGDGLWSNPANWQGARVPGQADRVHIPDNAGDVVLDPAFAGRVAGLAMAGGTLVLDRGLSIDGDAAVSGGVLTTPAGAELVAETLTIDAPAKVVMAADSKLTLTGAGTPLQGPGVLDTTSHTPNTVQYTNPAAGDLGEAAPAASLGPLSEGALLRVGSLTLEPGENKAWSAVIDSAAGFAYFGMDTIPGKVVKVRLSDFTRVDALTLGPAEQYVNSAVIDPANGFAYFGTDTYPGIVVKIQLSDFTRVGALTFNSGEAYPNASLIDPAGEYAYFGTFTSPGIVVRVRLSDFTRVDALTLNAGEDNLFSAVMDPVRGFAYFGTLTSPGIVVKIDLVNRLYVDANTNGANDGSSWANAFTSLASALTASSTGNNIWVAAGVYKPTTNPLDRAATFQLVDGVSIYGGFPPGGGDGSFAARNSAAYVTVLSGDIDNNDTVDANGVVADPSGIAGGNSYRVVTATGISSATVLDGLSISAGSTLGTVTR